MPHAIMFSALESLSSSATQIQPPDFCPVVCAPLALTESEKEKHAEQMTDLELVSYVECQIKPVGETLRRNIAYIREARERFAHPGRRVPVPGQPTFTEWIRQNLGISDRHVRRLLSAAKEPADCSSEDAVTPSPKHRSCPGGVIPPGNPIN